MLFDRLKKKYRERTHSAHLHGPGRNLIIKFITITCRSADTNELMWNQDFDYLFVGTGRSIRTTTVPNHQSQST